METRRSFLARTISSIAGLTGYRTLALATAPCTESSAALDLGRERASVLFELRLFERHYLPVLQAPCSLDHSDGTPRLAYPAAKGHRLKPWQAATCRLALALNSPATSALDPEEVVPLYRSRRFDGESFTHDYLSGTPQYPEFSLRRGRIRWQTYPYHGWAPTNPEDRAQQALRLLRMSPPEESKTRVACQELALLWPQVEKFYAELDLLSGRHITAYERLVPLLAEFSPAFAIKVLDRQWMRERVIRNPELTAEERTMRLRRVDSRGVSSYLSSALAFTMETLANNHFGKISRLLRSPEIYGGYNSMMPELVFAVLYRKVEILRQLSRVSEGCRGPA
jgi:hypothetical protein